MWTDIYLPQEKEEDFEMMVLKRADGNKSLFIETIVVAFVHDRWNHRVRYNFPADKYACGDFRNNYNLSVDLKGKLKKMKIWHKSKSLRRYIRSMILEYMEKNPLTAAELKNSTEEIPFSISGGSVSTSVVKQPALNKDIDKETDIVNNDKEYYGDFEILNRKGNWIETVVGWILLGGEVLAINTTADRRGLLAIKWDNVLVPGKNPPDVVAVAEIDMPTNGVRAWDPMEDYEDIDYEAA